MSRYFISQAQTLGHILTPYNSTLRLARNSCAFASRFILGNSNNTSTFARRLTTFLAYSRAFSRQPLSSPLHSKAMSTSTSPADLDPAIPEILNFWFEELQFTDWFQDSAKHDKTITSRFGPLVEEALNTDNLDKTWTNTPSGSLALIILLDQFTRNIYRPGNHAEPGLSWSGDAKALQVASQAIVKGFDRQIETEKSATKSMGVTYRYFFYMPFMHAEDLSSQVAAVSLAETMGREREIVKLQKQAQGKEETDVEKQLREWLVDQSVPFAKKHMNCVALLGRFPKRNEPLGREMTEQEKEFLEKNPMGF